MEVSRRSQACEREWRGLRSFWAEIRHRRGEIRRAHRSYRCLRLGRGVPSSNLNYSRMPGIEGCCRVYQLRWTVLLAPAATWRNEMLTTSSSVDHETIRKSLLLARSGHRMAVRFPSGNERLCRHAKTFSPLLKFPSSTPIELVFR